jgi:hypothetical protein
VITLKFLQTLRKQARHYKNQHIGKQSNPSWQCNHHFIYFLKHNKACYLIWAAPLENTLLICSTTKHKFSNKSLELTHIYYGHVNVIKKASIGPALHDHFIAGCTWVYTYYFPFSIANSTKYQEGILSIFSNAEKNHPYAKFKHIPRIHRTHRITYFLMQKKINQNTILTKIPLDFF